MKHLLLVMGVLVMVSCSSTKNMASSQLSGEWELVSFSGSTGNTKSFEEIFGERRPTLQFDRKAGTLTGSTGCNRLSTKFTAGDADIHIASDVVTTRMACNGYEENIFLNALSDANTYAIVDGQLRLSKNDQLIMAFRKR